MSFPQIYVVLVLVIPLIFVFTNRLREDVAGLLMAVLLGLAQFLGMGVLGPAGHPDEASKALVGLGTPEVITLIALFILTKSLDKYGITRWIASKLLKVGGNSERRLIALFALTAAFLSLFMNTLAAGALLLPSALDAARRTGIKPSKLLLPIAFGSQLGGAATYLTTANIIVSSLLPLANPPQQPLNVLDFVPIGGFTGLVGLLFIAIFGKYLIPNKEPPPVEISYSGEELTNTYQLQERLWEAKVTPKSPLVNTSLMNTRIGEALGMTVLGIRRGPRVIPMFDTTIQIEADDVLLLVGREERARQLEQSNVVVTAHADNAVVTAPNTTLAEVLVPPRSSVEGKTLRELAFRARFGFTALALWRNNRSYRTDIANFQLQPGDSLLLAGPADRIKKLRAQHDFVVVEASREGNGVDTRRVALTLIISLAALVLAIFAHVPIELAIITGVVVLLLMKLIEPDEAYSAVPWRVIFLIAGTLSVSVAMVQTGLAAQLGEAMIHAVEPFGPVGLVIGAILLSSVSTELMGGQVSPLVVGPIAISAAISLDVSPQGIAVVVAVANSVSFITPITHPVNVLMLAPGNLTFSDFARSGWALTVVCFFALIFAALVFWHL